MDLELFSLLPYVQSIYHDLNNNNIYLYLIKQ